MGKAVLPRQEDASSNIGKRDLASFDRALKFAEVALGKGPKVQLGTGKEGSGVGIIVDNNPTAAGRPGTAKKAKRDLPGSGRVKVTTMYVRSGIPSCEYYSSPNMILLSLWQIKTTDDTSTNYRLFATHQLFRTVTR